MAAHNHCVELFGAHGSCWGWDALLVWLHTLADAAIAFSYFAIPASLFYLARKYRIKRLSRIFVLYGAFVLLCGLTHVFDVLTVWYANYWIYLMDGIVRALTGLVSLLAAYVTVRCTPFALGMFARLAVFERAAGPRLEDLRNDPRYATPKDQAWRVALEDVRDLARQAREAVTPEEV